MITVYSMTTNLTIFEKNGCCILENILDGVLLQMAVMISFLHDLGLSTNLFKLSVIP